MPKKKNDVGSQAIQISSEKAKKLRILKDLMDQINTEYEKNGGIENAKIGDQKKAIFLASEMHRSYVKIGIPTYDTLCGGEPVGLPVIDYGVKGSGKSTFNYWKVGRLQKMGKICAIANVENGFDPEWAAKCGVNLEELVLVDQGSTFEETVQLVWNLMKNSVVDHWVIDSIHGQMTRKEMYKSSKGASLIERRIEDDTIGALPLKIGSFLRRITPIFGKSKSSMTIIGQARTDIDTYGTPITLTGGHALKHFARRIVRWELAPKSTWPKEGEEFVGFVSRLTLESQQLNQHQGKFFLLPFKIGAGIYESKLFADEAIKAGIIKQGKGSYWQIGEKDGKPVSVNGIFGLYRYIEENPEYLDDLRSKLSTLTLETSERRNQHETDDGGNEEDNASEGPDTHTGAG